MTKMTKISTTAGIDTSKAKLDVAVHGRAERWQVDNTPDGWRRLAAAFTALRCSVPTKRAESRAGPNGAKATASSAALAT